MPHVRKSWVAVGGIGRLSGKEIAKPGTHAQVEGSNGRDDLPATPKRQNTFDQRAEHTLAPATASGIESVDDQPPAVRPIPCLKHLDDIVLKSELGAKVIEIFDVIAIHREFDDITLTSKLSCQRIDDGAFAGTRFTNDQHRMIHSGRKHGTLTFARDLDFPCCLVNGFVLFQGFGYLEGMFLKCANVLSVEWLGGKRHVLLHQ